MTEEKYPKATHKSTLKVDDMELPIYLLEDGSRVILEEDMELMLKWMNGEDDE